MAEECFCNTSRCVQCKNEPRDICQRQKEEAALMDHSLEGQTALFKKGFVRLGVL